MIITKTSRSCSHSVRRSSFHVANLFMFLFHSCQSCVLKFILLSCVAHAKPCLRRKKFLVKKRLVSIASPLTQWCSVYVKFMTKTDENYVK